MWFSPSRELLLANKMSLGMENSRCIHYGRLNSRPRVSLTQNKIVLNDHRNDKVIRWKII